MPQTVSLKRGRLVTIFDWPGVLVIALSPAPGAPRSSSSPTRNTHDLKLSPLLAASESLVTASARGALRGMKSGKPEEGARALRRRPIRLSPSCYCLFSWRGKAGNLTLIRRSRTGRYARQGNARHDQMAVPRPDASSLGRPTAVKQLAEWKLMEAGTHTAQRLPSLVL